MPAFRESQSTLYSRNNPRLTPLSVNSRFTNMANQTFGDFLRRQLELKEMRPAELARRADVTKQNIGRLLNNTPHPITGAPPRVEVETVKKIAGALDWDLDEALLAAGYAPSQPAETYDILDIATVMFHDADRLTPEEKEELLTIVRRVAAGMISEHEKE